MLLEYDAAPLSPLGVVVGDLGGKEVVVTGGGKVLMIVKKGASGKEMLSTLQVVQPGEDGSYWVKFQRNKRVRLEEMEREEEARAFLAGWNVDNE
jgi:hypothetical protein